MGNGAKPASSRPIPSDAELEEALRQVRMDALLSRASPSSSGNSSNGSGGAAAPGLCAVRTTPLHSTCNGVDLPSNLTPAG